MPSFNTPTFITDGEGIPQANVWYREIRERLSLCNESLLSAQTDISIRSRTMAGLNRTQLFHDP